MKIRVCFSDGSVFECMNVVNSRKIWRFISKGISYQRRAYNLTTRVIKVEKGEFI